MEKNKNKSRLATVALILAIAALVTAFYPLATFITALFAVLAIVFSVICLLCRVSKSKAVTALVLAVLSVVVSICVWVFFANVFRAALEKGFDELGDSITKAVDEYLSTLGE